MTRFKIYLKDRVIRPRFLREPALDQTVHVVYGKGYAVSTHAQGIQRLVIYNDDNRHVFTADWGTIETIYMDDFEITSKPKDDDTRT